MERGKIIEMLHSGRIPEGSDFAEIQNLSVKYPYCSTFRVLLAMGAKEKDDLELKEYINTASIYVQDRSKLYDHVVRDGLLRKIEEGEEESSESTEPIEIANTAVARSTEEKLKKEQHAEVASQNLIDKDPLEEQIMAAAVMQLGELEIESEFEEGETPENKEVQVEEKVDLPEKPRTAGSAFSRFLTDIDRGTTGGNPERAIIEKFISEDRKITPAKKAFFSPTQMGKMSLMEDESFVTETLANIYERQGDYKKAARAYKNLGLKYPEKRRYFAALQKQAEEQL
ncbi:MAG: hypothetical protein WBG42_09640 [Cryomorphaceae bacterium]